MAMSYAVMWRGGRGPSCTGRLELTASCVRLEGACSRMRSTKRIRYADIASMRIGRTQDERIDGRPVLILHPRGGEPMRITSVGGIATLLELERRVSLAKAEADVSGRAAALVNKAVTEQ